MISRRKVICIDQSADPCESVSLGDLNRSWHWGLDAIAVSVFLRTLPRHREGDEAGIHCLPHPFGQEVDSQRDKTEFPGELRDCRNEDASVHARAECYPEFLGAFRLRLLDRVQLFKPVAVLLPERSENNAVVKEPCHFPAGEILCPGDEPSDLVVA